MISIVLASLLFASSPAFSAKLIRLGTKQFACKKGDLHLHTDNRSKYYPPGKQEKIRMSTKIGILAYTCRYMRKSIICPVDTTEITVKRTANPGVFAVECFGEAVTHIPVQSTDAPAVKRKAD